MAKKARPTEGVCFERRLIFAIEQGEVDVEPKKVKVAQGI